MIEDTVTRLNWRGGGLGVEWGKKDRRHEDKEKTRRQGNKSDVRVWAAGRTREGLPRI